MYTIQSVLLDDVHDINPEDISIKLSRKIENLFEDVDSFCEEDIEFLCSHKGRAILRAFENKEPLYLYRNDINQSCMLLMSKNQCGSGIFGTVAATFKGHPRGDDVIEVAI